MAGKDGIDFSAPKGDSSPALSSNFYSDNSMTTGLENMKTLPLSSDKAQILMESPFTKAPDAAETPMLSPEIRQQVGSAENVQLSTAADNKANGEEPDYRLVQGTDGKLRMEPVSADPLADGKLNIELDTKNKSIEEAIKQSDANMKEYVRELMSYWQKSHPGEDPPSWMKNILASEPNIPRDSNPVPVQQTPPQFRPQPTVSEAPPPPSKGWENDYRQGGGPGYGGGSFGGGGGGGGRGGGRGYYGGSDAGGTKFDVPNYVPDFDDKTGFVDRVAKTVMANEGALKSDGTPNFEAFNADDNGGISVGIRQWHAGGALPELLNAWKNENPEKFNNYFHGLSPAQINNMSAKDFNANPELVQGMKSALADKQYQGVQMELMNNWVKREIKTGMDLGLSGETELATFVDIANQYGQSEANRAAALGRGGGDQGYQMNAAVRGGNDAERFARIDQVFGTDNAQITLNNNGGDRLAAGASNHVGEALWAKTKWAGWCEGGNKGCAATMSYLLQEQGYGYAQSAGVHELARQLKENGWQRVPLSQAQPGDILYNSHHIGMKAEQGDYIYDNSSRTGVLSHRRIGNSGLSDGPVYALRPPDGGGSSPGSETQQLAQADNGRRATSNPHEPEAAPKKKTT